MLKVASKDPSRNHFRVSLVKSVLRMCAGAFLMGAFPNTLLTIAGLLFIIAEVLGVIEEIV